YKNSTIRQLFSRDNNLISLTRPEESQAYQAFDYDANDNLISIKQSGKPTISYDYDKRDQRIQQIWQRGTIPYWVKTAYDLDGRIIKQSASDESELTYNYTNNGIIDLINYSDGQYIKFTHDLHDRKIAIENNQGFFQQNIYDDKDKGKLSEIHLGYNSFQFGYGTDKYQLHGRLINQQTHTLSSGQSETRFCYGPTGKRQRAKTNYREPSIRYDVNYQYNLLGQLTQLSTQAEKGTTVQASDTEYTYDGLDRLIKANDHIQEKAIAFHYDANNSIVSEASNNQGNVKQIHYHYSPSGMLKKSLSNNGVIEYQHDTQGRMIQQEANKYIYDDADFLLQVISKNGLLTTFDYWPNGLLKSVNRAIGSDRHSQKYYFDDNTQLHEIQDINHSTHFVRDNTHIIASTSDSGIAHWFTANGNTGLAIDKGEANVFEYLPYGTPKKHTDQTEIMLGWKQHFYDPLTQLAYLNNRFYAPDIKQFLTPDKQLNPNLYNFGEANPMMFDDPNGLNAQRYINYAVGTSSVAFGVYATYESILLAIVGAILAVPTGGTSLSLSAGSAIAASVASTASGIALLGAQGAMDTGHPTTANALNYTSLAFSAVHVVTGLLALAPKAESLLERLGQFFSQRGGITNIHPEADASTIYHIGSDLYEGEKDVAKMLSASDIIRHGLHVTTKVTTDSFNISKALDKGKPPTYRQTIGGNAQNNPSLITAPRLNHRGNEHCLNSHCLSTGNQPSQIKSWHQRNQAINQHRQYDINLVDGFFNHDATSLFDNQL
ncbi:MAG: hypothetical protein OXE99_13540, partial [Cellvibrionales bacterium]|nr:hypothetical protein [Cellvibrionales bacterium]